jgi:hypothetical protein
MFTLLFAGGLLALLPIIIPVMVWLRYCPLSREIVDLPTL